MAAPVVPAPVGAPGSQTTAEPVTDIKLDKAYAEHMKIAKVQPYADKHGEDTVLYARKNARGEVKLAYCLATKFATIKDRGLLGAIEIVSPSA